MSMTLVIAMMITMMMTLTMMTLIVMVMTLKDDDIDIDDDDIDSPALIKRSWATTVRKVLQSPLPKTPLGKWIRTLSSRKSKTVELS